MKQRSEIDGLRAVAVLPVVFFHAGLGFPGGFVGVDIFFVISGFLITRLILDGLRDKTFCIVDFWERRIRRIVPALSLMAGATLVAGWFLFLFRDFNELGRSAMAQALLISNFHFWKSLNYFGGAAESKPLLHTWSLAVEEQFYLGLPLLLAWRFRRAPKSIPWLVGVLGLGSFLLCILGSYRFASANFYLLPTRAWELLMGSLLAAAQPQVPSVWLREVAGVFGGVVLAIGFLVIDREHHFPGLWALLPCCGTTLILWSNSNGLNFVGRILSLRILGFIGLISYSLYLWHWPLLVFSRYWMLGEPTLWVRVGLVLASIGMAIVSWRYVETPFRRREYLANRPAMFAFGLGATAVIGFCGLLITTFKGVPSRHSPEVLRYAGVSRELKYQHETQLREVERCTFSEIGNTNQGMPVGVFVWGDSHAQAVMPALEHLSREYAIRLTAATHSATPPLIGYQSRAPFGMQANAIVYNSGILRCIKERKPEVVLLVGNWTAYLKYDVKTNALAESLVATLRGIQECGGKVYAMKEVPTHPWDVPLALAHAVAVGRDPSEVGLPLIEHRRACARMDTIWETVSNMGVRVLDPAEFLVDQNGLCRAVNQGTALYGDSNHLTEEGAKLLIPMLEPLFHPGKTHQ